jgi:hypothetical protein
LELLVIAHTRQPVTISGLDTTAFAHWESSPVAARGAEKLTAKVLRTSLSQGTQFLIKNQ